MLVRLFLSLIAMLIAVGSAVADPYVYTAIDDPLAGPGGTTFINGINDTGVLTGYSVTSGTFHSFVDVGGTFTTIADPLAVGGHTLAQGINNAGEIAGEYTVDDLNTNSDFTVHGFVDIGGVYTTIDVPGAVPGTTEVYGINNAGAIVGDYATADAHGFAHEHGFVDIGGTFTTIDDPLGTNATDVFSINDNGVLTGTYFYINGSSPGTHGFVDNGGVFTTITDPAMPGLDTLPSGINDAGALVGQYFDNSNPNNIPVSFLDVGGVFTTISDPLADLSLGGTAAIGINNTGTIVGGYFDSTTGHGFVATPQSPADVPEPNSLMLLLAGLLGLGAVRRTVVHRAT
ncbi:MAG TPA: PEP-CTERM sorting domain-containing protein [Stellaceae bacterium]|nr:PEP-CTERM sorting domain-containing protein [Stellaceae bacterium]